VNKRKVFEEEEIRKAERENVVLQIAKLVCEWEPRQYEFLRDCYMAGIISPKELKQIVARRLVKILEPVRKKLEEARG